MFLGRELAEWLGGFCRGWGVLCRYPPKRGILEFCTGVGGVVLCDEKFKLGDRVSSTQCREAQESLASKKGRGGVGIGFPLETLDMGGCL